MLSPTGCGDPVFECASPSNPLQTRRSAAIEAKRPPREEHTWTAGDWVVGRNAKAEFDLTNDDLASIDVRRVGGGRLDIRRPKKYYNRPDLQRLSEQKHGGRATWKTAAQRRRPIEAPPALIRPASFDTARQRRIGLRVACSLCQSRPIGKRVLPGWLLLPCLCLPHRSPRHRQARDHTDDPHISFADDSLPCWQEHVPEPQGQEPTGHEDVARLKRPFFAHAQWPVHWASSIGPVGMWGWEARACGKPTDGDVPASAWSVRGLGRGGGDECGPQRCVQAVSVPCSLSWCGSG